MNRKGRTFLAIVLAAFALWAGCAGLGVLGQRKLIYEEGAEELYDWWMPRKCLEQGYVTARSADYGIEAASRGVRSFSDVGDQVLFSDWYVTRKGERVFVTGQMDKVYPALALLPLKLFPSTRFGGYLWSGCAAVVLLLSLCLVARNWWPVALACSMPFVFNLERGNPVWLSAACVGVFIAWWDSPCRRDRVVAALALAVAAVLKIAPVVLGLLYVAKLLRSRSRGEWIENMRLPVFAGLVAVFLFFVPFLFVQDGFAAIPTLFGNAAHHAEVVLRTADFGLIQVWRGARVALGLPVMDPWPGMLLVGFGLALVCGGLSFAAGVDGPNGKSHYLQFGRDGIAGNGTGSQPNARMTGRGIEGRGIAQNPRAMGEGGRWGDNGNGASCGCGEVKKVKIPPCAGGGFFDILCTRSPDRA